MRTVLLVTALSLFVGCAKKGAKNTAPSRDELANVKLQQPQPPVANNDKDKKDKQDKQGESANWLKDDRFAKKEPQNQLPVDGPAGSNKQPWNVGPPQGGFTAPAPGVQPMQPPGPAGMPPLVVPMPAPGMGVLQPNPVPKNPPAIAPAGPPIGAPKKAVVKADMFDLQVFIHDSSLVLGRMPTSAETYAALVQAKSPAAELVRDGSIILTGANQRESVWAFEANAYLNGGFAVSQNGVETLTAADLKQRLGK